MKPYPILCKDCKHSIPDEGSKWTLLCTRPRVNTHNQHTLASVTGSGTPCISERNDGYFSTCGYAGKLFEGEQP